MKNLTLVQIKDLIELEKQVHYNETPPLGQAPFEIIAYNSPILISAPHGARTRRDSQDQIWHEEDEYTAGMALLLSGICGVSAIAMKFKCGDYDPNFTDKDNIQYKMEIRKLIKQQGVRFVIDLHGAALYSPSLDSDQTIDLGTRQKIPNEKPSIDLVHVEQLEKLLGATTRGCDSSTFVVKRNRFSASSPGTITTFASKHKIPGTDINVQALQIEMKPQVRVAKRFTPATLYKSCGPFEANPACVLHMIQSLVNFIEYLKKEAG